MFSEEQLKAIKNFDKRILLLAGAGAGKTTTLIEKISYIIEKNLISPYEILAITFTNKAMKELKERIAKKFDEKIANRMTVSTFHGLCYRIIKENYEKLGYSKDITIYDEYDSFDLLIEINDDLGRPLSERKLKNIFNKKNKDSTERRIISEYNFRLKRDNAVDFSMMLKSVVELFKISKIQEYYRRKWRYVLVDEYQDTNDIQYEFLKLLNPNYLFVVGDPDQSIYGWRGANIKIILNFLELEKESKILKLQNNYRSGKKIVDIANELIKNNIGRLEKTLIPKREIESNIEVTTLKNEVEESEFVANKIKELLNLGVNPNEIAVLYRKNSQSAFLSEILRSEEIRFTVSKKYDVLGTSSAREIINLIKLAKRRNNSFLAKQFFRKTLKYEPIEILRLESEATNKGISILKKWEETHKKFIEYNDDLIAIISAIFDEFKFYEYYDIYSEKKNDYTRFAKFIDKWASKFGNNTDEFLKWLLLKDETDFFDLEDKESVKLMTIHTAKGLEFENVFIIGCNDGNYPAGKSSDFEEERRLFYVAITRAKKNLFFTKVKKTFKGFGAKKVEFSIAESPFLKEIM